MSRTIVAFMMLLSLVALPAGTAGAQTDKELRDQRSAAQKERNEKKKERDREIADASRELREHARELDTEYREKLRQVDVDFELKKVELQAGHQTKVATAEAEFQKKLSAAMMAPGAQDLQQRMTKLEAEMKAMSSELFKLKQEAAGIEHKERMAVEARKHEMLGEMDQAVLRKAESLGLTREYAPILASPIGGALTRPEEQWNERERKEVKAIAERNGKALAKYANGAKLREWERANMEEDFRLAWEEKRELNELASQRMLFGAFMLQADPSKPTDAQSLTDRLAEVERQEKLIKIRYDQLRKENAIKRREERRKLGG
jgi:hypothetical protein